MLFVDMAAEPNHIKILSAKWAQKLSLQFIFSVKLIVSVQIYPNNKKIRSVIAKKNPFPLCELIKKMKRRKFDKTYRT